MENVIWRGYELYFVDEKHDKFYRIIEAGPHVFVRFGRRGSSGKTKLTTYASAREARDAADGLVTGKVLKGYTPQYTLHSDETIDGMHGNEGEKLEELFLECWRKDITAGLSGAPTTWALFRGLCDGAKVVPGYRFILETLETSGHYKDERRDLVVGKVNYFATVRHNYSSIYDLGPIYDGDEEVLELVAGLHQNDHDRASSIRTMGAARRIHRGLELRALAH